MGKRIYKNEDGYEYIHFRHGVFNNQSTRIWVNNIVLDKNNCTDELQYPLKDAVLIRTQKGGFVIQPQIGSKVYLLNLVANYGGTADILDIQNGDIAVFLVRYHINSKDKSYTKTCLINKYAGKDDIKIDCIKFSKKDKVIKTNSIKQIRYTKEFVSEKINITIFENGSVYYNSGKDSGWIKK